jgi:hypothetical protein
MDQMPPINPGNVSVEPDYEASPAIEGPHEYDETQERSASQEKMCDICRNDFYDAVKVQPCQYEYCFKCITNWIIGPNTSCPTCRGEMTSLVLSFTNEHVAFTTAITYIVERRPREAGETLTDLVQDRWEQHRVDLLGDTHWTGTLSEHTEWMALDYVDTLIKIYEEHLRVLSNEERQEMFKEIEFLRHLLEKMWVSRWDSNHRLRQVHLKIAGLAYHMNFS